MTRRNKKKTSQQTRLERRVRWYHNFILVPLRITLLALLGVTLGAGGYLVLRYLKTSPALSVRTIEIRGAQKTPLHEIKKAGELAEGMNVFRLDLAVIGKRIQNLPWVKAASVMRIVPDKILVEIEEHRPAALIALDNLYFVSDYGEVFKRLQAGEIVDLPILTGIERPDLKEAPKQARQDILSCLWLLQRLKQFSCMTERDIAEVNFDRLLGFSVVLDPGAIVVRLGSLEVSEDELDRVCQVFEHLEQNQVQFSAVRLGWGSRAQWATVQVVR